MRMSCGRSDGKSTNQEPESPRMRASSRYSFFLSNYYNRLEYRRSFGLVYAAARAVLRSLPAVALPYRRVASGTQIRPLKPQAFLSLVQGRQSCQQQFWGVTPFRRDIAQ